MVHRTIAANAGSYALTGAAATLVYQPLLTSRQYVLGGPFGAIYVSDTGIRQYSLSVGYVAETFPPRALTLSAAVGSYTLTGTPANLLKPGAYAIIGLPGNYTLSGATTSLEYGREVLANAGAYALTGTAPAWNVAAKSWPMPAPTHLLAWPPVWNTAARL